MVTDSTHALTIAAHADDEHGGVWDDSKYSLITNAAHALTANAAICS
ncbi:hypothetical protein THIOSC15_990002 [uncultured Thiomicrorhabdus sp.]